MRRLVVFLLLVAAFALDLSGCGGKEPSPAAIVESWSRAVNAGDNEAAAALFRITDGKITLWHELPSPAADTQTA